jgi:hypothetical protein
MFRPLWPMEAITPTTDPFLGYTVYAVVLASYVSV